MIESITATIPCVGLQYTDLRPTISAESIEEYREQLAEVGRLAGNEAFVTRVTNNKSGLVKVATEQGVLYFDENKHEYQDEDGHIFMTGSTWAGQFEEPFKADLIAKKVADKKLTTVDKVLEGWDMKKEVSLSYGTTVHKALECGIKYNEMPNNPHLAALVQDYLDVTHEDTQASEVFVCNMDKRMCGTVDVLVQTGDKHVVIRDFKTCDVYKKVSITSTAKERWGLKGELLSIYQLQLSFYAHILSSLGYKVDGLEIWYEVAEAWKKVELPVLNIEGAINE